MKELIEELKEHCAYEGDEHHKDILNLIAEIERLEKDNKQLKWELGENIKQQITPTRIKQLIEELKQKFNEYDQLRAVVDAAKAYKQEVILYRCAVDANKSMERFPKMIKAELNLEQALRAAGEENK